MQCPLQLKSGLRETRNSGELAAAADARPPAPARSAAAAAVELTSAVAARAAGISAAPAVRRLRNRLRRRDLRWRRRNVLQRSPGGAGKNGRSGIGPIGGGGS